MKKVLKMKANLKYTILFLIDLVFILEAPIILKNANTINAYRYNILILFTFFIINAFVLKKINER